jgi:hypothetical protein
MLRIEHTGFQQGVRSLLFIFNELRWGRRKEVGAGRDVTRGETPRVTLVHSSRRTHGLMTIHARGCRVHSKDATRKSKAVEAFDCGLQIGRVLEFYKTEPSGVTGHAIAYHLRECNGVALFLEPLSEFSFTTRVRYISNKQSQHCF